MGNRGPRSKLEPYDDKIQHMYVTEGMTDKAIAEALPVAASEESVRVRRTKLGIKTSRAKSQGRYSVQQRYDEIKDQLPEAWEKSKQWHPVYQRLEGSSARVGQQFGVSQATAYRWLIYAGILDHRPSYEIEGRRSLQLFKEGWSVPRIATELSVSQDTVRGWLKRLDVDLSNPTSRMTEEEHLAWRDSIRKARANTEISSGRYMYGGEEMDSTYEVRFAMQCDALGIPWTRYTRLVEKTVEYDNPETGHRSNYGPDFVVDGIPVETKGIYSHKEQAKVEAWRAQRGGLAVIMAPELADFERVKTAGEGMALIHACVYSSPIPESILSKVE